MACRLFINRAGSRAAGHPDELLRLVDSFRTDCRRAHLVLAASDSHRSAHARQLRLSSCFCLSANYNSIHKKCKTEGVFPPLDVGSAGTKPCKRVFGLKTCVGCSHGGQHDSNCATRVTLNRVLFGFKFTRANACLFSSKHSFSAYLRTLASNCSNNCSQQSLSPRISFGRASQNDSEMDPASAEKKSLDVSVELSESKSGAEGKSPPTPDSPKAEPGPIESNTDDDFTESSLMSDEAERDLGAASNGSPKLNGDSATGPGDHSPLPLLASFGQSQTRRKISLNSPSNKRKDQSPIQRLEGLLATDDDENLFAQQFERIDLRETPKAKPKRRSRGRRSSKDSPVLNRDPQNGCPELEPLLQGLGSPNIKGPEQSKPVVQRSDSSEALPPGAEDIFEPGVLRDRDVHRRRPSALAEGSPGRTSPGALRHRMSPGAKRSSPAGHRKQGARPTAAASPAEEGGLPRELTLQGLLEMTPVVHGQDVVRNAARELFFSCVKNAPNVRDVFFPRETPHALASRVDPDSFDFETFACLYVCQVRILHVLQLNFIKDAASLEWQCVFQTNHVFVWSDQAVPEN